MDFETQNVHKVIILAEDKDGSRTGKEISHEICRNSQSLARNEPLKSKNPPHYVLFYYTK